MGSLQRRSLSINIHGASSLSRGPGHQYSTPQVRSLVPEMVLGSSKLDIKGETCVAYKADHSQSTLPVLA